MTDTIKSQLIRCVSLLALLPAALAPDLQSQRAAQAPAWASVQERVRALWRQSQQPKGEFETTEASNARVLRLRRQINALLTKVYPTPGTVTFGTYDADRQELPSTVTALRGLPEMSLSVATPPAEARSLKEAPQQAGATLWLGLTASGDLTAVAAEVRLGGRQFRTKNVRERVAAALWLRRIDDADRWSRVAAAPSENLLAGLAGASIRVWDADSGVLARAFSVAGGEVRAMEFAPDQPLLTAAVGRQVHVWNLRTDAAAHVQGSSSHPVRALAVSQGGHRLAAAAAGEVTVWDLDSLMGSVQAPHRALRMDTASLAQLVSRLQRRRAALDGQLRQTSLPGYQRQIRDRIRAVDDSIREVQAQPPAHAEPIAQLVFVDRQILTLDVTGMIRSWDVESGVHVRSWALARGVLAPLGRYLATIREIGYELTLVELPSGRALQEFKFMAGFAFSPDGRFLAAGGTLPRIYDAETGQEVLELTDHVAGMKAGLESRVGYFFARNGRLLISYSPSTGDCNVWEIPYRDQPF